MADEKGTWKRFRRLSFDGKAVSKRAKQAETKTTRHARKFVLSKLGSLRSARQHIITWLLIVGVLIGAVAMQTFWYQRSYTVSVWSSGGTYAEGVKGPINTLNPLYASSDAELSASKLLFSSLYRYDASNHLGNDLATSTSISKSERSYTITLRKDVYWNDGRKLTADDVVYTVDLMKSPDARSVMYGNWNDIRVSAVNDYTVRFTLPSRYAAFPHALTFAVLPKHIVEPIPAPALRQSTFSVNPIGTGPFKTRLLQVAPDGKHKILNMLANDEYYGGKPQLSRFAIHAYDNANALTDALLSGEVNAAMGINAKPETLPETYTTKYLPSYSGVYAILNTNSGLLKDKSIRRALQIGTDTQAVRKQFGYPVPKLWLPFVNNQLSGKGIPKEPSYNKKKAAALLTKSGWRLTGSSNVRVKKKQPLQLKFVIVKDGQYEQVAKELAAQWQQLGVGVDIEEHDPRDPSQNFVQRVLQPRDYDVLLYKLVIGADPDVYAYWHSSQASRLGYNFSNYSNDLSDDALTSARARNVAELRNEKYKDFAKQWLDDIPAVGLYQPVDQYAYGKSVHPVMNFAGVPTPADRYGSILYWSAEQANVYKTP